MIKPNLDDMKKIITIAKQAGEKIMQIYQKDFSVEVKEDSFLNHLIKKNLKKKFNER